MNHTYDIVVLGGGPGGYAAAIRAAQLGKSVAIVEQAELGGTCLHRGCIPSKALLRSAEIYRLVREGTEYGLRLSGEGAVTLDFALVQRRKESIVKELHQGLSGLISSHKIDVIRGTGRITGASIFSPQTGSVAVETPEGGVVTLVNERLIIATGSRPRILAGLEPDGTFVLTSDEALRLERLPSSVIIVGGGVIGVEWASMMTDFGVKVTLLEAEERLLPGEDEEVSREMAAALVRRGAAVHTGAAVLPETLKKRGSGDAAEVRVEALCQGERIAFQANLMLVAVGRTPNTDGIGLENVNISTDRGGFIRVNGFMQTSEPHIYAVGDVTGGMQLAHAAMHQGITAAEHICGAAERPYDAQFVPRCVFSHPQAASIGLTEKQAKEAGHQAVSVKYPLRAAGKARVNGNPEGFVKIVADAATHDVLGVHIIGDGAAEMIGEAALARLLDATPWEIAKTIHPHPTLSEALGEAALKVDARISGR